MEMRPLGNSGLNVTPLAFGGNVFGWTVDEARSFELLDAFVAAGGNFIDTADMYSRWKPGNVGGESETIIGRWLKARNNRDKLVVATKVGLEMGPDAKGLSPAYIRRAVEASLRRLQTDYIDLYQSHTDDPDTPIEDTLRTYDALVREGKVRAIGASNFSADRLEASLDTSARLGLPAYVSLQPHYSLVERAEFEGASAALCVARGISVIPYFPLAAGFLTGKYRSEADLGKSARGQGAKKYLNERGLRILGALDEVSARHAARPASVALAWLLSRPGVTAPIASATSLEQLETLLASVTLELDASDLERLNTASAA
ncbi:MAG: aldo/keto reductase [Betaproteobacteria bacterium]|nr:aldo/keto reductase [Betaproteobacteria bacterium]